MFCFNCGKEVGDEDKVCSECGASLIKGNKNEKVEKPKKNIKINSIDAVGFVFSAFSFLFGFILITMSLASQFGRFIPDIFILVPAFVGLGMGVYRIFGENKDKLTKIISIVNIALSAFTLVYTFIGYVA